MLVSYNNKLVGLLTDRVWYDGCMRTYPEFYASLHLPSWAPPPWVFGVAWSIIYPLFAFATAYTIYRVIKGTLPRSMLWLILGNWAFNLAFTPVQLGLEPLWPATIVILLVLGTLAAYQRLAWRHARLAFWLLVPYLAWGLFATALQATITVTN